MLENLTSQLEYFENMITHIETLENEKENYTCTAEEQEDEIQKGLWFREDIS